MTALHRASVVPYRLANASSISTLKYRQNMEHFQINMYQRRKVKEKFALVNITFILEVTNKNESKKMAEIKTSSFDKQLRIEAKKEMERLDITWYKLAKFAGIDPVQNIYNFRDGGGLNGENTYKLMKYLGIDINDIEA